MTGLFCFVPRREACPPDHPYSYEEPDGWLVDPVTFQSRYPWLIAECMSMDENAPLPDSFERVPARLERMLQSGKRYYPAIALARASLERETDHVMDSRERYAERFADEIEKHLAAQREAPYFMAQATEPCATGYRFAREYVWAVAYDPHSKHVFWVTDDYFIYHSPIDHFRVQEEHLRLLPVRRLPPWARDS